MLGAIAGDVIGSTYEFYAPKTTDFELIPANSFPTDDSLLTLAVAKWLMDDADLVTEFKRMVLQAPHAGWGGMFSQWAVSESAEPYNSFGNGSAMRVSPVGYACDTLEETLERAEQSAAVTHDHPEGIKGAQATAAVVFLARTTRDRDAIRSFVEERIGYDVSRSLAEIRPDYTFNETCQRTVPEAIVAFLESHDYESAVRNAVSLGGDADTLACITGGIAEAFYGPVPEAIRDAVCSRLEPWMIEVVERFHQRFPA
jgi:ADP-ribosylglycohydrolase